MGDNSIMIAKAIKKLNPNAQFNITDSDINSIEWLNGTTPISVSDIQAKIDELPTAEEERQAEENLKASAKAKLIAGEKLTEEEANILVGV